MARAGWFSVLAVGGSDRRGAALGRPARRGFTLLETMMALVIIGVGVLAFVDAQSSFHRSNGWSSRAATAMLLANEVREMTRHLPRHDPVTGLTVSGTGSGAVLNGWGMEGNEVTIDDIDDLDDLDGMIFGLGGDFQGPVNGFREVVPEITLDGEVATDEGETIPMQGWTQRVIVEKVDPYNFSTARANAYQQAATSQFPFIRVDQFPVRVTVVVEFQDVGEAQPSEVTRLTWVVPAD